MTFHRAITRGCQQWTRNRYIGGMTNRVTQRFTTQPVPCFFHPFLEVE